MENFKGKILKKEIKTFNVDLFAPTEYVKDYTKNPGRLAHIVNGCGAAGAKFDFVPDSIYGLSIKEACNIHDYMYHVGDNSEDKIISDRVFFYNTIRIIDGNGGPLKLFRKLRALWYFLSVNFFGGPAYWKTKNEAGNIIKVKIESKW